ncbi:MAG: hypothetical protein BZ135_02290 [Methanosphaera sp. rholeuAM6]|nr:MAG: hypothetical protein BZ135_02290 [Methanosphaera sp. rholeuAM6]
MVHVSVVIPIYNVESYLTECLNSIVNQTLRNIEIICINDGSTDNSLDIIEEFAKKDRRIKVITQENAGHAVATNRGIDMARGKYLFLMDSDDTLDLEALEKSFNAAEENNVDFVLFKAINYDDSTGEYYESEFYSMDMLANHVGDNIFNFDDVGELAFNMAVTPWTKLYNKKFIRRFGLHFPEGLIFEDNIFFWECLLSAKRIYFLKEFLFTRRWHDASSTKAGDKRFVDSIIINSMIIDVIKHYGVLDDTFKRRLYNRKIFLGILRFKKIKDEYKQIYFEELQKNIVHWIKTEDLYDFLQEVLEPKNKYLLNLIITANNAEELDLALYNYEEEIENRYLERKNKTYLKEISDLSNDLNNITDKTGVYSDYMDKMEKRNNELSKINQDLHNEYEKEKELNHKITNSFIWRISKPFRYLKNRLK